MSKALVLFAWSVAMRPWPIAAIRELLTDKHTSAGLKARCDMTRYDFLNERYKDQTFAGEGANGCVVLARDSHADGIRVAIKISKQANKKKMWVDECNRARSIHENACKVGGEAKKLVERYMPTCLEVGGTDEAPYIVMHAAPGKGIDAKRHAVPEKSSAAVFAQIVGALAAMHGVGLSHNDLHGNNVVFLEDEALQEQQPPLVAFIDFGEVVPLSRGWYRGGYKQDENLLAREAYKLAGCREGEEFPILAESITEDELMARKKALFLCLEKKWGNEQNTKNTVDKKFFDVFEQVILEAWMNQNKPPATGVNQTKVLELYNTEFILGNQPALLQLFPSASAGICAMPDQHAHSNQGNGVPTQDQPKMTTGTTNPRTADAETTSQDHSATQVTTTAETPQTTKNFGERLTLCNALLKLFLFGHAVNLIEL